MADRLRYPDIPNPDIPFFLFHNVKDLLSHTDLRRSVSDLRSRHLRRLAGKTGLEPAAITGKLAVPCDLTN